jgi:hypothetical protein
MLILNYMFFNNLTLTSIPPLTPSPQGEGWGEVWAEVSVRGSYSLIILSSIPFMR